MAIKVFQLPGVNNTTLFNIREQSYLWQGKVNSPVYLWVRMVWEFHQKIFVETRVTRHSSQSLKLQGLSVSASPCRAFLHEGAPKVFQGPYWRWRHSCLPRRRRCLMGFSLRRQPQGQPQTQRISEKTDATVLSKPWTVNLTKIPIS